MSERFVHGEAVPLRHGWGGNKKLRSQAIEEGFHDAREQNLHPERGKFDTTGRVEINPHDYHLFPLQD